MGLLPEQEQESIRRKRPFIRALRKRACNLTARESKTLQDLFELNPAIGVCHEFKEKLGEYWWNVEGSIYKKLPQIPLPTDFGVDPKEKHPGMFDPEVFKKMVRGTGFEPVTPCV